MRSGRSGSLSRWTLVGLLFLAGCDDKDKAASVPPADTWDDVCIDQDGDGRGFQCADGDDCNDNDPEIYQGCKTCTTTNEGCECAANAAPVECVVSKEVVEGSLLCKTGTRYCRDSKWSACEGVKTFQAPPPSHLLTRALVDPEAGAISCGVCSPDCYQIEDMLGNDAGYGDSGIVPSYNGGITLNSYRPDTGVAEYDAGLLDDCRIGDTNCDGIPDDFQPYPDGGSPFSSEHNTIFMDLGPGDQQEESFTVRFYLNTADIYLYLDMTGSMGGERANLIGSLRSGNYMPPDRVNEECADRNLNGRTSDEEYLKDGGVAGNLACLIRDSRIGAGWHRDLPFPRPDSKGFAFGPHDFELFQHEQDITNDVDAVLAGLNRFTTRGGINRPEGGIMGLYALATGGELYLGWDRPGNPPRAGCPAGTWGYACFRDEAVPIVIWMTDAPITNGPAPRENQFESDSPVNSNYGGARAQPVNWEPSALVIETGNDGKYNPVGTTHETFATAIDLGDINSSFKTYVFDSTSMRSDISYASLTGSASASYAPTTTICASGTAAAWSASTQTAPDAVFKIKVTESEPITISTRGSRVQSAIAIVDSDRIDRAQLLSPTNANSQPSAPAVVASPVTFPGVVNIAGTTASGTAYFGRDSLGCLASNTGSTDKVAAGVVKFNLAQDAANVRIVNDANYAVSTTLFAGRPAIYTATDVALGSLVVTEGTATKTGNSNDKMNTYNLGNMNGVYKRFTGGDTSSANLNADYPAATFSTGSANTADCAGAGASAKDAVFDFSLSATTRLRIEGTGMNGTLQSSFDHMLALVSRGVMTTYTGITNNYLDTGTTGAYSINFADIPSNENAWVQYNGTSGGTGTALYLQNEVGPFLTSTSTTACTNAAAPGATVQQAVFTLTIPNGTPSRSYDFDTGGSAVNSWLSLHQNAADTQSAVTAVASNATGTSATVTPQALGAIDNLSVYVNTGALASTSTIKYAQTNFGASCASTVNGKDAVYTFTVASSRQVQVTTGVNNGTALTSGNPAFDSYVGVFANSITNGTRVAGGCDNQTTVVSASGGSANANAYDTGTFTATPGVTYYVVVKNFSTTGTGNYGLWVRDVNFSANFLACDYGSNQYAASIRSAKISRTLGPGKYFIVVKPNTTTGGGAYQLNVRRTPTVAPSASYCSHAGTSLRTMIDQTLPAGQYSLILRGYTDTSSGTSTGTFNVIFRDLGIAPLPVSCAYDANTSNTYPTALTVNNMAARDSGGNLIDYYLVTRGNTATGTYNIRIEDGDNLATTQCAYNSVTMTYSQASPAYSYSNNVSNAEWTGTLPLGEYYVVLKGYDASGNTQSVKSTNDWGMWQFSVGDQAHYEGTGTFDAKRWLGANGDGVGGVREALQRKKVRVIMVDSTNSPSDSDYYSDQQMKTIASATGAVALDGTPLLYKINEDGTGLGTAIVGAVNTLAGNLAMDVGVRFVEAPDSPAPRHFNFRVEAVDSPGDSCLPPIDTDNDPAHVPDTHVNCRPGATPLFKISLSNPNPPYSVPRNNNDPTGNGGYNMRIDLIADGQYVVDNIPVYVIPEDVIAQPGDKKFDAMGTYQDTVPATGCVGNEAPKWGELKWTGTVPGGTQLVWNVCTAATAAELDRCTLQTAVSVTSSNGCLTNSDCTNGSFCNSESSLCELRLGPACSGTTQAAKDASCGFPGTIGASCLNDRCVYTGNVNVNPALPPGAQGKRFARVQAVMSSNAAHTRAPTVNSWNLNYTCSSAE